MFVIKKTHYNETLNNTSVDFTNIEFIINNNY